MQKNNIFSHYDTKYKEILAISYNKIGVLCLSCFTP